MPLEQKSRAGQRVGSVGTASEATADIIPHIYLLFLQWSFYHHRPFLGHQFRLAWLLHPFLATEPRERGQRGEWGEPRVRHNYAHRLPAEVSTPTLVGKVAGQQDALNSGHTLEYCFSCPTKH